MTLVFEKLLVWLSRKLIKIAAQKALGSHLPLVYEKIDKTIPISLFNLSPPRLIEKEIEYAIRATTGRQARHGEAEIIASLYNPIANAARIQRIRK